MMKTVDCDLALMKKLEIMPADHKKIWEKYCRFACSRDKIGRDAVQRSYLP